MASGFCISADYKFPCREFTFEEFPDEKDVIVLILEYFKRSLPDLLKKKKDYYSQPIIIDPNDIDLITQKNFGDYVVVLSIADDNSSYPDNDFQKENTEYVFQIDLLVRAHHMLASLENLIKLKSVIKTMLVNMDANLDLLTNIEGFSYGNFGIDKGNRFIRQGTYRFSIQSDNYKQ